MHKVDDITQLREHLRQLLASYEQAGIITIQECIVVERHLALLPEHTYQSYQTIAGEIHVTKSRVEAIIHKAMRRLRHQPVFVQALNTYLQFAPYPSCGKRPIWMTDQGSFEENLPTSR
jgi:DNA-directed RNA polymerase sigma subunit (sigma70/sigma32)